MPRRLLPAALAALLVSGCTSSGPAGDPTAASDVAFSDCGQRCTGEIDGAEYEILLPESPNGSLLIYSHGYRSATPTPPDFDEVDTAAEPAPGYSAGRTEIAEALLERGYALAGSGWASNGWAVEDGVRAAADLYALFREVVGDPARVYVWGDSLGGLVSQEIAETAAWVDGAAPLCGVHAGVVPNMDLALDLAHGIKVLLAPDLVTQDFDSVQQANAQWAAAAQAVVAAAGDVAGGGPAKVLALGALVDAADQTQRFDGADPVSRVKAVTEAVVTGLAFSTFGRHEVEQRFGGPISDNTGTDYAARFSAEDRQLIDLVGGSGTARRLIGEIEDGARVAADPTAVARARESGGDPGDLRVPTITLHTAADPLVIVQNQSFLAQRLQASADDQADLVQLFTVAPAEYPEDEGAPYGAGHCEFTPQSRVGLITLLDEWVREGIVPEAARVAQALGADSGFDATFEPPPWPEPDAVG